MAVTHVDSEKLRQFLSEDLLETEVEFVSDHLEVCQRCCEQLDEIILGENSIADHLQVLKDDSNGPQDFESVLSQLKDLDIERFEFRDEIARGGMGIVYRGVDKRLERDLAFKVLTDSSDQSSILRFIREAKICSRLQHPGIVPVHDLGKFQDGRICIIMKLIGGQTLGSILNFDEPESENSTGTQHANLQILSNVAQTIAYAHSRGVIHRDLKPSNVMVGEFGEVQVMDWGLAKELDAPPIPESKISVRPSKKLVSQEDTISQSNDDSKSLSGNSREILRGDSELSDELFDATEWGAIFGTPAYMAPEQAKGDVEKIGIKSDVFSLGAILFEVLTGLPPFYDKTSLDALEKAKQCDTQRLAKELKRSSADQSLKDLALKSLDPTMECRTSSATEFYQHIQKYFASTNEKLRRVEIERATEKARAESESRRRKVLMYSGIFTLALTLVAIAAGLLWLNERQNKNAADLKRQFERTRSIDENQERISGLLSLAKDNIQLGAASSLDDKIVNLNKAFNAIGKAESLINDDTSDLLIEEVNTNIQLISKKLKDANQQVKYLQQIAKFSAELTAAEEKFYTPAINTNGSFRKQIPNVKSVTDFAKAFANFGIQPTDEMEAVKEQFSQIPDGNKEQILRSFYCWYIVDQNDRTRYWISKVLNRNDPDNTRRHIRHAISIQSSDKLEDIAYWDETQTADETTTLFLIFALKYYRLHEQMRDYVDATKSQNADRFWPNWEIAVHAYAQKPQKLDSARTHFNACLAVYPNHVPSLLFLSQILSMQTTNGNYERTTLIYDRILKLEPNHFQTLINKASICLRKNDFDQVAQLTATAINNHPEFADPHGLLAIMHSKKGEKEKAKAAMTKLESLEPNNILICTELSNYFTETKKWSQAEKWARKAIEFDPEDYNSLIQLGIVLGEQNNWPEAIETNKQLVKFYPDSLAGYLNLGICYKFSKRHSDAIEILTQGRDRGIANPTLYVLLGEVLYKEKLFFESTKAASSCLKMQPTNLRALRLMEELNKKMKAKKEKATDSTEKNAEK